MAVERRKVTGLMKCPYCDAECYAEFVDVGVGGSGVQVTPYECGKCLAREMGHADMMYAATPEEKRTGWWRGQDTEEWECSACGWKDGKEDGRLTSEPDRSTYLVCTRCGNSTSCKGKRMSSTKIEFDVLVSLSAQDVIELLRGQKKTVSAGPPGSGMVQANARVQFAGSDEEKRQIIDALTRGPNTSYDSGFSITRWGDKSPVPGSTEWLMLIASNADRIWIKCQRDGALIDVPLLTCSEEETRLAVHAWLSGNGTPEFRVAAPPPDTNDVKMKHLVNVITKASASEVHRWLREQGVTEEFPSAAEQKLAAIAVVMQGNAEFITKAWESGKLLGWFHNPTGAPAVGPALKALEEKFRGVKAVSEPGSYEKLKFIEWVDEHAKRATGTGVEAIRGDAWKFLKDLNERFMREPHFRPSERQVQWLNDCYSKAMSRAKPIGHLLPPTPPFADPRLAPKKPEPTYAMSSPPRMAKAATLGAMVGEPITAAALAGVTADETDEPLVTDDIPVRGLTAEDMKTPPKPVPTTGLAEALRALRHSKT